MKMELDVDTDMQKYSATYLPRPVPLDLVVPLPTISVSVPALSIQSASRSLPIHITDHRVAAEIAYTVINGSGTPVEYRAQNKETNRQTDVQTVR